MSYISNRTIIDFLRENLLKDEMAEIQLQFLDEESFLLDRIKGIEVIIQELGKDLYNDTVDSLVDALEEDLQETSDKLVYKMKSLINPADKKKVPVFISSTFRATKERKRILKKLENYTFDTLFPFDAILVPVEWDEFKNNIQDSSEPVPVIYPKRNAISGIFIGLLSSSLSLESEEEFYKAKSEIEFALQHQEDLKMLIYHKEEQQFLVPEVLDQQNALAEMVQKILNAGIYSNPYKKPAFFKKGKRFLTDLTKATLGITKDFKRRAHLKSFFRFSATKKKKQRAVLIGYPAIHPHDFSSTAQKLELDWYTRLLPPIVFEDSKTISKLINVLVEIGNIRYSTTTIDHHRFDDEQGNRIWLCLPRNRRAKEELEMLGGRNRFQFNNKRKYLEWRTEQGEKVIIPSPLDKYLYLQRDSRKELKDMNQSPESKDQKSPLIEAWHPGYGRIIGRDYAVISRFRIPNNNPDGDDFFYHYYIAGIRGLGTWGAGWYIDRFPEKLSELVRFQGEDDVQAVLEITFENYRIVNVKDVSHCNQSYFYDRINDDFIKAEINEFTKKIRDTFDDRRKEVLMEHFI